MFFSNCNIGIPEWGCIPPQAAEKCAADVCAFAKTKRVVGSADDVFSAPSLWSAASEVPLNSGVARLLSFSWVEEDSSLTPDADAT